MTSFLYDTIQRDSLISFPGLGISPFNPPASINVFGRSIYFYGIIIGLAFMLAILWCAKLAPKFGIRADDLYDMMIWLIPLSILGARLYFVIFRWSYYRSHLSEVFAVWEGGLAIYGGIIAGVAVCYCVCRYKKISFPSMLDLSAFGVLLGQAMGRWGNFFNREAFGAETDLFCRMGLTAADGTTIYVHPTFLYESLWNVAGLCILGILLKRRKRRYPGQFILFYFFWYGLGRVWIEGLRTDSLYLGSTGIRVSQLLSAVLVLTAGTLLFLNRKKNTLASADPVQESAPETAEEAAQTHNKEESDHGGL